ncbi:MAG: cation:proton antiporter, partial [Chloroflexi bacterium]|nr:cation:proton antiporter [Chloroflexota bacterium]
TAALAAAVTAMAVAGKLIGCGAGSWGLPRHSVALIGVGMVPRGEVGLIVAAVGRSLGVIPADIFSVVVVMSLATTLIAPPVLRRLLHQGGAETDMSMAASVHP